MEYQDHCTVQLSSRHHSNVIRDNKVECNLKHLIAECERDNHWVVLEGPLVTSMLKSEPICNWVTVAAQHLRASCAGAQLPEISFSFSLRVNAGSF